MSDAEEFPSPDWQAIVDAMSALYPGVEPRHVGFDLPAALSLNLQGCSGVTSAERDRMVASSTAEVLAELAVGNPLLVTDPARR